MISDVLSDAVTAIDQYLQAEEFEQVYCGDLRHRIVRLRIEMDDIRVILDASPPAGEGATGRSDGSPRT